MTTEKLSEEEIRGLVDDVLRSPANMIKMLQKYGDEATYRIDHGCLHLAFDNNDRSTWNDDILELFPLRYPVRFTCYEGRIAAHFLDWNHEFDNQGTHEILEQILGVYVNHHIARKML